jgi:ABC-2 type transport system ATP-binding protein
MYGRVAGDRRAGGVGPRQVLVGARPGRYACVRLCTTFSCYIELWRPLADLRLCPAKGRAALLILLGVGLVVAVIYWVRRDRPAAVVAGADGAGESRVTVAVGRTVDPGLGRIAAAGLSKQYGAVTAVDGLSFEVVPGRVTGFLGPNGAGKSTTLRMLLGLTTATSGTATIGGRRYEDLARPAVRVGAVLEAEAAHPARTGRNHLRVLCAAAGVPASRADELLVLVGLVAAADRKVKGYSLGMRQRLGIAAALVGDPQVLVLDEPGNGLDPEGIRWLRELLAALAAAGRTVLVSSHQLAEVQQLADDVIIIAGGRLVLTGQLSDVLGHLGGPPRTLVRADDLGGLTDALAASVTTAVVEAAADGVYVTGADARQIGAAAQRSGVVIHQMVTEQPDLESVFLRLTSAKAAPR